jgi:hypothetical protein
MTVRVATFGAAHFAMLRYRPGRGESHVHPASGFVERLDYHAGRHLAEGGR